MFEKIAKCIREKLQLLVTALTALAVCFRVDVDQVCYVSEKILHLATISPGTSWCCWVPNSENSLRPTSSSGTLKPWIPGHRMQVRSVAKATQSGPSWVKP
jgi:hypothetical protein